jgi:hypothetical protein
MNEQGMWQEQLQNKYLTQKTFTRVKAKQNNSPFWKGLMGVKYEFFDMGSFIIGNGKKIRF